MSLPASDHQRGRTAELFVDPPRTAPDGQIEFGSRYVESSGASWPIWFRFPAAQAEIISRRADPFVIALLIHAMGRVERLTVHGTVSDGLLPNLADFQAAYNAFHRGIAGPTPMAIQATDTAPATVPARAGRGIGAFSGGVDSCFTVFRHTALSSLQPKRQLGASLMMHGFDIPLAEVDVFARAVERSRRLTDDAALTLHTGTTNLRTLPIKWEDIYASAVAACLSFFQPLYSFGLVPSFQDWAHTKFTFGSSPLTDPMLSSLAFPIVHDGATFGRLEKLRHLAQWPGAMRHLRVCWQGEQKDRNCCRCEKCLRTMLMLELAGVTHADAFPLPLDLDAVGRLVIKGANALEEQTYLLEEARRRGITAPWVKFVARSVSRNHRRQRVWRAGKAMKSFMPSPLQDGLRYAATRLLWQKPVGAAPAPRSSPAGAADRAG